MLTSIPVERFTRELFDILDETFEHHHGIYLDRGTSLFETLATISPEMASSPVSRTCGSLAAQVAHVTFYLNVLERDIRGEEVGRVDWGEIWRTVEKVTPDQWDQSRQALKESYQRLLALLHNIVDWNGEKEIRGALAILVHTAYHLGEIRQALCILANS